MDAVALDGVSEGPHHVLLADDLIEVRGPVAAVKRGLAGHPAESRQGISVCETSAAWTPKTSSITPAGSRRSSARCRS